MEYEKAVSQIQEIKKTYEKGLRSNGYPEKDVKALCSFLDTYTDPVIAADLFKKLDIEINGNGLIERDDLSKLNSFFLSRVDINEDIHRGIQKLIVSDFSAVKEGFYNLYENINELGYNIDLSDLDSVEEIIDGDPELSDFLNNIRDSVSDIVKDLNRIIRKCDEAGYEFPSLEPLKSQCQTLRECVDIEEKQNLKDFVEQLASSDFKSTISKFAGIRDEADEITI